MNHYKPIKHILPLTALVSTLFLSSGCATSQYSNSREQYPISPIEYQTRTDNSQESKNPIEKFRRWYKESVEPFHDTFIK